MQIQTIDQRPPLSAVFALAKAERDSQLPQWRADMTTMSAEIARKYFGTLTEEVVRDGVNACVNLLSIGLLKSTSGTVEPVAWLQTLRATGVRGVSRLAVEMVKACDSLPTYALVSNTAAAPAPSFLLPLLAYASRNGPARAYSYLVSELEDRTDFKRSIDLANWLTANTPSGRVIQRSMSESFGYESPDADEVIHRILSLACGIAKVDPFAETNFSEEESEMILPELPVTTLGPNLLAEARRRYDAVVAKIPSPLRLALIYNTSTWFDRFIVPSTKSPLKASTAAAKPKPPTKAKAATKKKSPKRE